MSESDSRKTGRQIRVDIDKKDKLELGHNEGPRSWLNKQSVGAWSPPVDVYDTENQFIVLIEIAGMKDEKIDIAVEGDEIVISGKRTLNPEKRSYYQLGILFGEFRAVARLMVQVEIENVQAEYNDGFLTVIFPRIPRIKSGKSILNGDPQTDAPPPKPSGNIEENEKVK